MKDIFLHAKSKRFIIACFCFLFGITLASVFDIRLSVIFSVTTALVIVSFFLLYWKQKTQRIICLFAALFFLGMVRYGQVFPTTLPKEGPTHMIAFVAEEPDVRQDRVNYIVQPFFHQTGPLVDADLIDTRIFIRSELYPRYSYGDVLDIRCALRYPEPIEDFRYDLYLAKEGIFLSCNQPYIQKLYAGEGNIFLRYLFAFKGTVAQHIAELWHEPYAGFMAGLLYGYRGGLGSLNELFAITGVTHIIAISGYNITLIATLCLTACTYAVIPRKKAFWLVCAIITTFVIFAGASASVVRAGIMGIIVLLARQLGRGSSIAPTMLCCACIMVWFNPLILLFDAGFQLSFLATLGLVYISPIISTRLHAFPALYGIKESVISTLSATISTLPIILYQFERLSIVSIMVNVLVLWILPFTMLFGFISVVSHVFFAPLAAVFSWMSWAMMAYVVYVVRLFASLSFAAVPFAIPLWCCLALYCGIIYGIYKQPRV